MSILQAIILGIVQGLTEFLPVSSSGHLIFFPKLFGWQDQGLSFDAIMHLGTLVAVVVYFRQKLKSMIQAVFSRDIARAVDRKLAWLLILSIIPASIVGLLLGGWIEENTRAVEFIAFGFIFWGVLLYLADFYGKWQVARNKEQVVSTDGVNWKQALFIGCAQAIALFPGTSRSGITMTAGLFSKLDRKSAAEFSFLMSIPVIGLAGMVKLVDLFDRQHELISVAPMAAGFLAAAVSGFLAIAALMRIIQKWSFTPFVVYRIVLGILILAFMT